MKAKLLLVLHFHQPVGNFDDVIKRVCERCYKPFLDTIVKYPKIKWNLHLSGSLLEWLASNAPEITNTVKVIVESGQAELLGGAMYEPILPVIPEKDRIGQIKAMQRYLLSTFNVKPEGAWISERVWEPQLASSLAKSGIKYLILDDTHLLYAGLRKDQTYGYFVSEDNGNIVRIFPSDKKLRYTMPFRAVDESLDYIKNIASKTENAAITYGDDVEKFGEWPHTFDLVYKDKWLERFLSAIMKNSAWLSTQKISDHMKDSEPSGMVYVPAASYEDMLKWALPVDANLSLQRIEDRIESEGRKDEYLPFIRGGFFRNFFTKYHEANQMHKRMLYVSNLLAACAESGGHEAALKGAYQELYRGQCNCAYWHGLFGGLYLFHLRKAVYEHILKAEEIYEDSLKHKKGIRFEVMDFDSDGHDEIIAQNKDIWLCVKPSSGGTIAELDVKKIYFNLLNVMTRYREFYHENASGEGRSKIYYDSYRRAMFVDHFLGEKTSFRGFEKGVHEEEGDFIDARYDFKASGDHGRIVMKRNGTAYGQEVRLSKEFILKGPSLEAVYNIKNTGKAGRKFHFATEIPFIMPDAASWRYNYVINGEGRNIDTGGEADGSSSVDITDAKNELSISIGFSKECSLWRFPLTTFSRCEKGFEENYQGSLMVPNWRFTLKSGENFRVKISLNIEIARFIADAASWKEETLIRL
ncbi:MAG: DUF1926 domain-containing protein [Candidatus Omnitrophica bacterium]|nr:DUF1926 domain-containing protein [Candidatus Omnitrophota bacterium]